MILWTLSAGAGSWSGRMTGMFRYWRWQDICAAAVLLAGGLLMLFKPGLTLEIMATAVGVVLIVVGLIFVLAYFIRRRNTVIGYDLILGIVITAMGIFVCLKTEFVVSILPVLLGVCIIISGLLKLQRGLDLKKMSIDSWGYIIILALVSILLGAIVLLRPFSAAEFVTRLIGISFIYSGVTDLVTAIYVSRFVVDGKAKEVDPQDPEITLEKTQGQAPDGSYDAPKPESTDVTAGNYTQTGADAADGIKKLFHRKK